MSQILFNFDYSHWPAALLSFIPALLNIGIFLYAILVIKPNHLRIIFLHFVFFLILWQVSDTFIRLSASVVTALWWSQILSIGPSLIFSAGLHFTLVFTNSKKWKNSAILYLVLYAPALFFMISTLSGIISFSMIKSQFWGFIVVPGNNPLNIIQSLWFCLILVLAPGLLIMHYVTGKNLAKENKAQTLMLIIGFLIPGTQALLTEGILPLFFDKEPVPLSSTMLTVFSFTTILAIRKFRLLQFSPFLAWETTISNIDEGIMIINNEEVIQYVNSRFCALTGYDNHELIGRKAGRIFAAPYCPCCNTKNITGEKYFRTGLYETGIKHKSGNTVCLDINGFPYRNQEGQIIGSVMIHVDRSHILAYEKRLAESQMRMDEIVNTVGGILYEANASDCHFTYISPQVETILGYSREECTCNKIFLTDHIHQDDVTWYQRYRAAQVSAMRDYQVDFRIIRADGRTVWLRDAVTVIKENEKPVKLRGVMIDISKQKAAEKELIESEERFASLVETAHDAIIMTDEKQHILLWNTGAEKIFGYAKDEIFNKSISLIAPQLSNGRISNHNGDAAMTGNTGQVMLSTGKRKTGEAFPIETSIADWKTRNQFYHCYIMRDVSRQKAMEAEVKKLNAILSNIFTSLDQYSFWSLDVKNNKALYVSPGTEAVFGKKVQDFFKDPMLWKKMVFRDDEKQVDNSFNRILEGSAMTDEFRIVKQDGSVRWVNVHAVPDTGNNGSGTRIDGVAYDVSERKMLEEKLNEKINELNMFVYRASHDLRGPLASVIGLCNIGRQEMKSEEGIFYLDSIGKATQRLDNILHELTQIATVMQESVHHEPVNLKTEVDNLLSSIQHLENYKRVRIITGIDENDFHTDRATLVHILQNLIINSINYRDDMKEDPFVQITSRRAVSYYEISVKDNGIGIPKELQPRIFEMFFRGNESSKGSGLGLYIVKTAVDKLKGTISVESEVGKGTTFILRFPVMQKI